MSKVIGLAAGLVMAMQGTAGAQQFAAYQPNSCQKFSSNRTDNEAVYLRAACVAARAGVTSPANGPLSQEELLSILVLMSLQQTGASHRS